MAITKSFCPFMEKPCRTDCRFYDSNDFGFGYCKRSNTIHIAQAIESLAESVANIGSNIGRLIEAVSKKAEPQ
jgi:hypothetical protein